MSVKILTFSTLYPNAIRPFHGVFVENRLRQLLSSGQVSARVLAPIPWFPSAHPRFGLYADYARTPVHELRHGISVDHPRYPVIPKIGMNIAPYFLYRWARPYVARLIRNGHDFDLIDAHYFYPDGVAAAMLARDFKKPFVVTARGADINQIATFPKPRRLIQWAANQADAVITVCQALKDGLTNLGVSQTPITVLRNGVDLEGFRPANRDVTRSKLGLRARTMISVGHLIPRKAHDLVIAALRYLPETGLMIVGDGPEDSNLRNLATRIGVTDRVRFLGWINHEDLPDFYSASDAMVLASSSEGWANVLLESMACGTPVVASNIPGTDEIVTAPEAGILMRERTPEALADAARTLLAAPPERAETRAFAEKFSWDTTTEGQLALFRSILQA